MNIWIIVIAVVVVYLILRKRAVKRQDSPLEATISERRLAWTQGMASAIQDYQRQISALSEPDRRSMARQIGKAMADEWDDGWYIPAWARNQSFMNQATLISFGRRVFVDDESSDDEILKEVSAMCAALEVYGHRISPIDLPKSDIAWYLN